jgi:hypothetical protein
MNNIVEFLSDGGRRSSTAAVAHSTRNESLPIHIEQYIKQEQYLGKQKDDKKKIDFNFL